MAEEHHNKSSYEYETGVVDRDQHHEGGVETTDRGLFGFHGKKEEEKRQEEVLVSEFDEKVTVSEYEPKVENQEYEKEKEKEEKLHRSNSSSSSVSIYIYDAYDNPSICNKLRIMHETVTYPVKQLARFFFFLVGPVEKKN